jgi:UDP-N-acetylmuramoylalanine--D-glutamate ligase
VGTIEEINVAIALYIKQNGISKEDDLIKIWWELNKNEYEAILKQKDKILSQFYSKNLPPKALNAYQNPNLKEYFKTLTPNYKIIEEFEGKKIGIFGMGREGQSSYKFFRAIFPEKLLILADENLTIEQVDALKMDKNVKIFKGEDIYEKAASKCEIIFKTPGIPSSKFSPKNREKITSQTDLFLKHFSRQTIGVTGTKGKSTTSNLIFACLQKAGIKSVLVGNIGVPMLDKFYEIDAQTMVVAELSAHQLEKITIAPKYAVFLNLFEEHLDAFGTFSAYKNAKYQIIEKQNPNDFVFYAYHDKKVRSQAVKYAKMRNIVPVSLEDYFIYFAQYSIKSEKRSLLRTANLLGLHNLFNIVAAYKVCRQIGLSDHDIIHACLDFKPLPHRLEFVGKVEDVKFYNDSISTTPQSAVAALETIGNVETLLLGGMDRGINYDILAEKLPEYGIKNIALIGKAGERIGKILQDANFECNYLISNDFREIIRWAKAVTSRKKAVLLSPAAPSYDQFRNFEERGETFRQLVLENEQQEGDF